MTTNVDSTPSAESIPSCKTLVDTLVGLGSEWAAFGLKIGKTALVTSAETLGKTAATLDTLAAAFEQKAAAAKAGEPEAEKQGVAPSGGEADLPAA